MKKFTLIALYFWLINTGIVILIMFQPWASCLGTNTSRECPHPPTTLMAQDIFTTLAIVGFIGFCFGGVQQLRNRNRQPPNSTAYLRPSKSPANPAHEIQTS